MESLLLSLIASVMLTVALSTNSYECPSVLSSDDPARVFGQSCYQFVLNQKKTFQDAENFCRDNGGHLAAIKNDDVNNFLSDTLQNMKTDHTNNLWIGLHRRTSDGYKWTDGSSLGNYDRFISTARSTYLEYNVCLNPKTKLWSTYVDGVIWLKHDGKNFICEYPAVTITTVTTSITTAAISSTTPSQHDNRDRCPSYLRRDKYLQIIDSQCLLFVMNAFVSFHQAERFCVSRGGGLVTAFNFNEIFLQNQLHDTYGLRFFDAWIGLRFYPSEGVHKWLDGTFFDFENFRSDTFTETDQCVAISPTDGKWVAKDCNNTYLPFVCQFWIKQGT